MYSPIGVRLLDCLKETERRDEGQDGEYRYHSLASFAGEGGGGGAVTRVEGVGVDTR
jgi:hypothetical protein